MVRKGGNASITAADTDTTIYSVTSGRAFEPSVIIITNNSGATARVRIWDGASATGTKWLDVMVANGETVQLNNIEGMRFYTSVTAQSDNAGAEPAHVWVFVGGEEE
ncbi:MAG: hypothetical protein DRP12_00030 [Candidatus Aenigmatarchaeota archaeon]|nr:MAG: hypothetical protein DRP12_00030 [Candidatus Aenigmarchaeota archaeon]